MLGLDRSKVQEHRDVEEAEADLLRFRKNRKEIERRERDEEQHKV